jgi:hypothetical protein
VNAASDEQKTKYKKAALTRFEALCAFYKES